MNNSSILIAGLGNTLLGDDGIGPYVVHRLNHLCRFPENVRVEDLGTPGLNLQPFLCGVDHLLVIDAVSSKERAVGSLMHIDRAQLHSRPLPPRVSPHDLGLVESIALKDLAEGTTLDATLLGIVVRSCEQGAPMSPEVLQSYDAAQQAILHWLHGLGVRPTYVSNGEESPEREDFVTLARELALPR